MQLLKSLQERPESLEPLRGCPRKADKANFGLSRIALIFSVEDNYPIP